MALSRKDVKKEDTWDMESVYPTVEAWEKDFEALKGMPEKLQTFKGKLGDKEKLVEYLELSKEIDLIFDKLYIYANCRADEDTGNSQNTERMGRFMQLFSAISSAGAFFSPELSQQTTEYLENLLNDPKLTDYDNTFKDIIRVKPHLLPAEQEELLSKFSEILSAPSNISEKLRDSDMKFPSVQVEKDGEKKDEELTGATFVFLRQHPDRNVRSQTAKQYFETYKQFRETLATTLNTHVRNAVIDAKLRGYKGMMEYFLFENNIPEVVPQNLFEVVGSHIHLLHRYGEVRRVALGIKELHWHDLYVPMVKDVENSFSYEEAVRLTLEAAGPFGTEYMKMLRAGLMDERWVDKYPNQNKRNGAYHNGCYNTLPFVMMNYIGSIDSVSTLAHELGHAMHSQLAKQAQPITKYGYSIFTAEIASITNETFLAELLLKDADPKTKAFIINNQLEAIRTTFFRQTMFAEFEALMYECVWNGGVLTADFLEEKYLELNRKYYGPNLVLNDEVCAEWSMVPHFYYNFYVYQYATGLACAFYFATQVRDGGQEEVDNFLNVLRQGGSDYPTVILKNAGLDVTKKDYLLSIMREFERLLDEFEASKA